MFQTFFDLSSHSCWEDNYQYLCCKDLSTIKCMYITKLSGEISQFLAGHLGHWRRSLLWQFLYFSKGNKAAGLVELSLADQAHTVISWGKMHCQCFNLGSTAIYHVTTLTYLSLHICELTDCCCVVRSNKFNTGNKTAFCMQYIFFSKTQKACVCHSLHMYFLQKLPLCSLF